jgi:hypothetical protein
VNSDSLRPGLICKENCLPGLALDSLSELMNLYNEKPDFLGAPGLSSIVVYFFIEKKELMDNRKKTKNIFIDIDFSNGETIKSNILKL